MDNIGYYFSLAGIGFTRYGKIYLRLFTVMPATQLWEKDHSLFSIKYFHGHFLDIELFGKSCQINLRKKHA